MTDSAEEGAKETPKESAKDKAKAQLDAKLNALRGMSGKAAAKFKGLCLGILRLPLLLFTGDLSTKLLMMGFVTSLALIALTSLQLIQHFGPRVGFHVGGAGGHGEQKELEGGLTRFFGAQKELQIATANLLFLEKFSASLRAESGNVRAFDAEIYLECDSPDTSAFLKGRVDQVRELVSGAIQGQVYEKLMTDEGKLEFRQTIAEAVNRGLQRWKVRGSIKRVFFSRFVMG